ncbi:MAG: polyamine aminopropyltransferase [Alphaproteobacteria bacterium]|nr:polyamine aminopropyltransferase [Alphaproteobacteria bacterium]
MRAAPPGARVSRVLLLSALLIATCGLIYELVAGALASYLLGNSITQFSLIIGVYLSAMGLGSYLSKSIDRGLLARFVEIEVAVALLGGFEAPALFAAYTWTEGFKVLLFSLVGLIGVLVGLELPLLMRILEKQTSLKELVARVLFLDYIGALVASLLFPLLLVPHLGLLRTSIAFGLLNAGVALWTTFLFEAPRPVIWRLRALSGGALAVLAVGMALAGQAERAMESHLFADAVVHRQVTPYQRIVVTHHEGDTRLFLDGALQFSTADEYRYHEALVHPAMAAANHPRRVLVLGGGDGLAVREILRHPEVVEVVLVDLDPAMTGLFRDREDFASLNAFSLRDARVTVINDDAFTWLRERQGAPFDVAIVDFPDPNNYSLGKLYTTHFFRLLARQLTPDAVAAIQSTSPMFSPDAYWCVVATVESEGFVTRPYHAYVPSFGEWGFVLFAPQRIGPFRPLPPGLRFLDAAGLEGLFHFPPDLSRRAQPANRLDNQVLVRLYEQDWREVQGL